jgi:hypothetical protein
MAQYINHWNEKLEGLWLHTVGSTTYVNKPETWESVIAVEEETDLNRWRPDRTVIISKHGGQAETTLFKHWLSSHLGNGKYEGLKWGNLLEKVIEQYPDSDAKACYQALCAGLGASYTTRGRYEAAGEEHVVLLWFKKIQHMPEVNVHLDALLVQAIQLNLLVFSEALIEAGAQAQAALGFVRTKEAYQLLKSRGASSFQAMTEDARELDEWFEQPSESLITRHGMKRDKKGSVYEYLVARPDVEYNSSIDRDSILNDMARERLKKPKAGTVSDIGDDERQKILASTIEKSTKWKEAAGAISKCLPEAFNWRFQHQELGEVGLFQKIMIEKPTFLSLIKEDLAKKIEKAQYDLWAEKTSSGVSAFEVYMQFAGHMVNIADSDKVAAHTHVEMNAKRLWDNIEQMVARPASSKPGHERTFACPVSSTTGKPRMSIDDAYDKDAWGVTKEDFLVELSNRLVKKPAGWFTQIGKVLATYSSHGYNQSGFYNLKSWVELFDGDIKKTAQQFGKEAAGFVLMSKIGVALDEINSSYQSERKKAALKKIEVDLKTFALEVKENPIDLLNLMMATCSVHRTVSIDKEELEKMKHECEREMLMIGAQTDAKVTAKRKVL